MLHFHLRIYLYILSIQSLLFLIFLVTDPMLLVGLWVWFSLYIGRSRVQFPDEPFQFFFFTSWHIIFSYLCLPYIVSFKSLNSRILLPHQSHAVRSSRSMILGVGAKGSYPCTSFPVLFFERRHIIFLFLMSFFVSFLLILIVSNVTSSPVTCGSMVWWYNSRFGCEISRVRIPYKFFSFQFDMFFFHLSIFACIVSNNSIRFLNWYFVHPM